MLGLPEDAEACLFDLDGVLTRTSLVHAAAWQQMFDVFLLGRSERTGEPFRPFEPATDYVRFVNGKLRLDGVRSFLASRGIEVPEGSSADPASATTIHGLGARKNELVLDLIRTSGVETYEGSVRYVRAARDAGLRRAVVSASRNCREVLVAAGIEDLFETRVDGTVAAAESLRGKPAPDMFLAAAVRLGVRPARAGVFEDAVSGVQAGRAGDFGWVVGVDRGGQAGELHAAGADVVVTDLSVLMEETN